MSRGIEQTTRRNSTEVAVIKVCFAVTENKSKVNICAARTNVIWRRRCPFGRRDGQQSGAMFVNSHPPPYKVNNKTALLTWKSVTVSRRRRRRREKTIVFLCKQSGVAVAVAAAGSIPTCLNSAYLLLLPSPRESQQILPLSFPFLFLFPCFPPNHPRLILYNGCTNKYVLNKEKRSRARLLEIFES